MSTLSLSVACDTRAVALEVASQRMLEWVVSASEVAATTERAPLNIALIIDRSGSMSGDKLRFVQQAACHVLDQLGPQDRASVVAYDDTVNLLAPGTLLTPSARDQLKRQITALRPGGSTNLSGGWLEGCRAVAEHLGPHSINRALLLTDGLANHGITDIEELSVHARKLRQRGIATSTFGVGLDFNEQLLELLAEQGGGHFFFIERPNQIPEFFRQELGELLTVVAREAVLALEIPAGVALDVLGELPHEREANQLRVFLGDLCSGERRTIYARALTPPDAAGTTLTMRGRLSYATLDARGHTTEAELALSYMREAEVRLLPTESDLLGRAAEVELATAARQALRMERAGQRQQAQVLMQAAMAAAPPAAAPVAAAYASLTEQLGEGMEEAERKKAHFGAYQTRQSRKK